MGTQSWDDTVQRETIDRLPQIVEIMSNMIQIHDTGLDLVSRRFEAGADDDPLTYVTLRLMSEVSKSNAISYELWQRGYYHQSMSVGRTIYEFLITCEWLRMNPGRAPDWTNPVDWRTLPRMSDMRRGLEAPEEQLAALGGWYDETSGYVHPRYLAVTQASEHRTVTFQYELAYSLGQGLSQVLGLSFLPLRHYVTEEVEGPTADEWLMSGVEAHLQMLQVFGP